MRVKEMLVCALTVAVTAVLAQIALSVSPVPFTMALVGVFLTGGLLGSRLGMVAMLVYLLLGAFGAPVFTGGKGGLPVLFGPTGGFLWGYIGAVYLIGRQVAGTREGGKDYLGFGLATLWGLLFIYLLGTIQLKFVLGVSWRQSVAVGVAPFILPDLLKVALTAVVVIPVRRALAAAHLLPQTPEIKKIKT